MINNYININFNCKLAKMFGLHSAIYLSERMNKISSDEILERTTITLNEQEEIEKKLKSVKIITEEGEINSEILDAIVYNDLKEKNKIKLENILSRKTDEFKAEEKKKKAKEKAKSLVLAINEELKVCYYKYIDAVYERYDYVYPEFITQVQEQIDLFSKRDLDVALGVLNIASVMGYSNIEYAIQAYKERFPSYKGFISKESKPIINLEDCEAF